MAGDGVVDLVERDLGATLGVQAKRRIRAGDHPIAADGDRRIFRDLHHTDLVGDGALRFRRLTGHGPAGRQRGDGQGRDAQGQQSFHLELLPR